MKVTITFCYFVLYSICIICAPYDSGFTKFIQPDGIQFTARSWGDEYFSWMEDREGYRITKGLDKYYYYAQLDSKGEFYPTSIKVSEIVFPKPAISYKLERSETRILSIENERQLINNSQMIGRKSDVDNK